MSPSANLLTLLLVGAAGSVGATTLQELPKGAHAGECYARTPAVPTYRTERRPVAQPPLVSWRDVPAVFKTQTRQVLVTPARICHETLAAVMGTRMHWVEHPGPDRVVETPAVYRWVVRRVLVSPAHLVWKPGRAAQGFGDGYGEGVRVQPTGEVMCRVKVPARYEERRVRVLVSPGRTCILKGPVTRERVVEHFVVRPTRVIDHVTPPVYRAVTSQVVAVPAHKERVQTPQPPRFVETKVMASPGQAGWRRIVCAPRPHHVPTPAYGQPYQPTYAQPRPGAAPQPSYNAPSPDETYGRPQP